MCFAGLMEFKELFGSFTGHRVENRSTRMRYGSIKSARSEKRRSGFLGAVGDGCIPVPDGSQKTP
ncbi:hypothetical protein HanRHA438_Chr03g0131031 [Helianthus annuus]|nr:hypothetical protein HanRHA438_Chr03g0131031 [Helianthus annuus]